MVGKTFKGLTDEMLRWQTGAAAASSRPSAGSTWSHVRPELVVEIRFNDVQRSPRYPGGIALRFARVVRYREDKPASEVEPLEGLVAMLPEAMAPAPAGRGRAETGQRIASNSRCSTTEGERFDSQHAPTAARDV